MPPELKQVLRWVLVIPRGGPMRVKILQLLLHRSLNTHQIAKILSVDYSTARHHLDVLTDNWLVATSGNRYGLTYHLSPELKSNLTLLQEFLESGNNLKKGRKRW